MTSTTGPQPTIRQTFPCYWSITAENARMPGSPVPNFVKLSINMLRGNTILTAGTLDRLTFKTRLQLNPQRILTLVIPPCCEHQHELEQSLGLSCDGAVAGVDKLEKNPRSDYMTVLASARHAS